MSSFVPLVLQLLLDVRERHPTAHDPWHALHAFQHGLSGQPGSQPSVSLHAPLGLMWPATLPLHSFPRLRYRVPTPQLPWHPDHFAHGLCGW